jgi:hypothetical protein
MSEYPFDVGRTEAEIAFLRQLERLHESHGAHAAFDAWTMYPPLVVTVTISDPEHNCILRTLRIDFDGSSLVGGNDPSHQIDPQLDPDDPDHFEMRTQLAAERFADVAFSWFSDQADRPIDRQEWREGSRTWRRWVLADTGRPLVAQGFGPPDKNPDQVVRLQAMGAP